MGKDSGSTLLFAGFDIAADREADVLAWHTEEHLPERLALPGFNRGRRFECVDGAPKFLILYELESLAALRSAPYLQRLNNPTSWTRRSVSEFRNNFRTAYQTIAQAGHRTGDRLAAIRVPTEQVADLALHLEELSGVVGISRLLLAVPDMEHSTIATTESHASGNAVLDTPMLFAEADAASPIIDLRKSLEARWPNLSGVGQYQLQVERLTAGARWLCRN